MSFPELKARNRGAYGNPFSGVGVEFFPLGVLPDHAGLVLYKAGFPNRFYLSRVFKKITGEAPIQFRRLHTPNPQSPTGTRG